MVKSYLKYEHSKTFGLVASATSNAVWASTAEPRDPTRRSPGSGIAVAGADEEVILWDLKKGENLGRWRDPKCNAEVTVICPNPTTRDIYAVGYGDGSIRLWDFRISTVVIAFNGHRSSVSCLAFDEDGVRLASGAKDTDIIIWDLVGEVGLVKLRGHKEQITGIQFLKVLPTMSEQSDDITRGNHYNVGETFSRLDNSVGYLVSTSRDAILKLWDVQTQHCIETHVTQSNGQCWAMAISADQSGLITAGNDGEIKVWGVDPNGLHQHSQGAESLVKTQTLRERGALQRRNRDRTTGIAFHPDGRLIAAHGSEKLVEVWRIRSEAEMQKRLARKRKRRREKSSNNKLEEMDVDDDGESIQPQDIANVDIQDLLAEHLDIRAGGKVRSIDWVNAIHKKNFQMLIAQTNNQLELWKGPTGTNERQIQKETVLEPDRIFAVDLPGHRTDVRALAISSDDRMLASASQGSLKIWNLRTTSCIRTMECGFALCATFLPGDKIVAVGNRQGELELFDITSSTPIETLKAHEEKIWSLHVHPDGKSIVTGSEDKSAKFFKFEVVQETLPDTHQKTSRLRLAHTRTLKVNDAILSLRFSPDSRLIALALLDNTVKVFFTDTLKLYLNLYGHKLPVLSLDISYDSKMIVTCSADKNVRLWGLDFGDCHKAFFAHQDNVTQVAFLPKNRDGDGHHFFSTSKDRTVKYWDGDKFEQIQTLRGHHGEIWAMAMAHSGDFLVTTGHDKSIRVWIQTDDLIFLEEEREKELEDLYESTLMTSLEADESREDETAEAASAGKATIETLVAGEKIAEALHVGIEDLEKRDEFLSAKATQPGLPPPSRNPIFLAHNEISAELHLLNVVQKIKAAALQDALLILTFDQVCSFFVFLRIWADRRWNMPLTCRILFFLLKTHHKQIVAGKQSRTLLDGIRADLRRSLEYLKHELGFNMAALRYVERKAVELGRSNLIEDNLLEEDISKGKKKRAFVDVA